MGKRTKTMIQRSRHRGAEDGTHEDKYAAKRERDQQIREAAQAKRFVSDEQKVNERRNALRNESEEVLASLPGGTVAERLESARLGLFHNQDSVQSSLTPRKAK